MEWFVTAALLLVFVALFVTYAVMAYGAHYAIVVARAISYSLFVYAVTQIYPRETNWLLTLLWSAREVAFCSLSSWLLFCIGFFVALEIFGAIFKSGGYKVKFVVLLIEPAFVVAWDVLTAAIVAQYIWGLWHFLANAWVHLSDIPYWGRAALIVPIVDFGVYQLVLLRYVLEPVVLSIIGTRDLLAVAAPYWYRKSTRTYLRSDDLSVEYTPHSSGGPTASRRTILAVSDTHLPASDGYIHGNSAHRSSDKTIAFVEKQIAALSPDVIVHCGDVTDAGHHQAWTAAEQTFKDALRPLFAVPGNHDVNFARMTASYDLLATLSNATQEENIYRRLAELMKRPLAESEYPIVVREHSLSLVLLLLDSNRREPMTPFTNALGLVGDDQLNRAEELIVSVRRPQDALIIVLHHHVLIPDFKHALLRCIDSEHVVRLAFRLRASCVIHGHKHMPYVSRLIRDGHVLTIVSCGSAHHLPSGPFADKVEQPSCYAIDLAGPDVISVRLLKDGLDVPSTA